VIGGAVAVRKEPIDRYEVFIPIDGRPVTCKDGANEEDIAHGRLLLTFRDGKLLTWLRLE
jgi:hypothetical protein